MAALPAVGTPQDLAAALHHERYRFVDEIELQDGIEALLTTWGLPYLREFILNPRDRIDFLVGSTGIEVKINSSVTAVERQLWRYADDARIHHLILVTTKSTHRAIPATILGKPVFVVHLLNSIF